MKSPEKLFSVNRIIPVVVLDEATDEETGIKLAKILLDCGINNMEITLRTTNATRIIAAIAKAVPQMIVGAGTIMNSADYLNACEAGAKFIVSPGATDELFAAARSRYNDVIFMPGVITPGQAMEASSREFYFLKFFPAEAFNAYEVLKALASPLKHIRFCPTGGINLDNMAKYLSLPNVFAVGMSSIVDRQLIIEMASTDNAVKTAAIDELAKRCRDAVAVVDKLSLAPIKPSLLNQM